MSEYGAILANDRFLGRTNPVMKAAVADGGSMLDREYIQRCARQMVDLNLFNDLTSWVYYGLSKKRESGGKFYTPKTYDISGKGKDFTQSTESRQPELINYRFNWGSDGMLQGGSIIPNNGDYTFMAWVYPTSSGSILAVTGSSYWSLNLLPTVLYFVLIGTLRTLYITGGAFNTWSHYTLLKNGNNHTVIVNADPNKTYSLDSAGGQYRGSVYTTIGARISIVGSTIDNWLRGGVTDCRFFGKVISTSDNLAIYNKTKWRYEL